MVFVKHIYKRKTKYCDASLMSLRRKNAIILQEFIKTAMTCHNSDPFLIIRRFGSISSRFLQDVVLTLSINASETLCVVSQKGQPI